MTVTDYHAAGEPFRIVTGGAPEIPGTTVLERREAARSTPGIDAVRELLVREPRGHSAMYGCFLVPPQTEGSLFGVLFWHREGYSTACGHGTIALGAWAVRTGRVEAVADGVTEVPMDVPSGRVIAAVTCEGGEVRKVAFRNVDTTVLGRGVEVATKSGPVKVDLAYSGAIYACVPASAFGLEVVPEHHTELVAAGREVKAALSGTEWARYSADSRLGGVYGVILYDDLGDTATGPRQRNVTVFADGQVDRSPCGSGTSARLALLAAEGRLREGDVLTHGSIIGTTFTGRILPTGVNGTAGGVATEIEGTAHLAGESVFTLDPADELGTGFTLR
ncbi:proline racemase family protein [Amycolatopsis sp. NPDC050768]|uniref:proline racemase family protein n=1 Tax=Amycolatopsis sp. NPDC050768 TaxID=3154839 RepID=UPI0033EDF409